MRACSNLSPRVVLDALCSCQSCPRYGVVRKIHDPYRTTCALASEGMLGRLLFEIIGTGG